MARGRSYQEKKNAELLDFKFKANHTTIVAMSAEDFVDYAIRVKKANGYSGQQIDGWLDGIIHKSNRSHGYNDWSWQKKHATYKTAGVYLPVIADFFTLSTLAADMQRGGGVFTKYAVKVYKGKAYITFKGYAGLRKHIQGTRFLLNNPGLVKIGIGVRGAARAIKSGLAISVIFSFGFHALEQLLDDTKTWHDFVAGVTVDTVTALTGGGIVWASVYVLSGSMATLAIGPMVIVVVGGALLTSMLGRVAEHYKLAEFLAAFLEKQESEIGNLTRSIERELNWWSGHPIEFMHGLAGIPMD